MESKNKKSNRKKFKLIISIVLFLLIFLVGKLVYVQRSHNKTEQQELLCFNSVQKNWESYYLNSLVNANPNSEVKIIDFNFFEKIKKTLDDLEKNLYLTGYETINSALSESSTSFEEELLKSIKTGELDSDSTITMLSPICSSYEGSDCSNDSSPVTATRSKENTSFFLNDDNKNFSFENIPKKPILIITKNVGENESVPALPSWTTISHTHKDYHIKQRRIKAIFNSDYTNSHKDNKKPSDKNQGWIETENDLSINKLFFD